MLYCFYLISCTIFWLSGQCSLKSHACRSYLHIIRKLELLYKYYILYSLLLSKNCLVTILFIHLKKQKTKRSFVYNFVLKWISTTSWGYCESQVNVDQTSSRHKAVRRTGKLPSLYNSQDASHSLIKPRRIEIDSKT